MSDLKIIISEQNTEPPYNHLSLTGRTGAWVVVKIKPGQIMIQDITWLLKSYLFIVRLKHRLARNND